MRATDAARFRFVQMDVPGRIGIDDGRYLLRAPDEDAETVIVVQTLGAPPAGRPKRRHRRPRPADFPAPPAEVPVTRITVIPAEERAADEAAGELDALAVDFEAAEEAVVAGLRGANRLVRAHRIATQDPYGHEIGRSTPLAVRVGFGTGGELADGQWTRAFDVPPPERRRRRADTLRPQERLAELLAGREGIDACETLLLRARADLDQGRLREAGLQLMPGLDALLAELAGRGGPGQEEDLANLRERRESLARVSAEALRGDLTAEQIQQVADALGVCERVLRRRQALREPG
jgi:acyl dehydratase